MTNVIEKRKIQKNTKQSFPFVPARLVSPELKKQTHRFVQVTMDSLDGTPMEMRLTYPAFSCEGDVALLAAQQLSRLVKMWTKCFLKISGFKIAIGTIFNDGSEIVIPDIISFEIPLGKVYKFGKDSDEWVSVSVNQIRQGWDKSRIYAY